MRLSISLWLAMAFTTLAFFLPLSQYCTYLPHLLIASNDPPPRSFLSIRKESSFNLGSAETKLLYTLHWLTLDAADECILESDSAGRLDKGPFAYLYPLSAITVRQERHA